MWPDHETETDLVGFRHLVSAITDIANNRYLLPATIGVFGDWGSGKSSLIKMAISELEKNKKVLVVSFNGWLFEGYDDAKSALMETIIAKIVENAKLSFKIKKLALKLLKRINWLRVAGKSIKYGLALSSGDAATLAASGTSDAIDAVTKANQILKDIKEEELDGLLNKETTETLRRGVLEFREDFKKLISESGIETLVVIIDDLDRCLPDTIIETLEAIKLFLFVHNTAFIIGADERLVKYAVKNRFPELPGEKAEVGRDYLEKLIQFPIRVPPMSQNEMEIYVALLYTTSSGYSDDKIDKAIGWALKPEHISSGKKYGLAAARKIFGEMNEELEDGLQLAQRIGRILALGLSGNPRQCKRFLNTLLLRLQIAKNRNITLQQKVLAKLMLLEYFRPEYFKKLAEMQAEQNGKPAELKKLESERNGEQGVEAGAKEEPGKKNEKQETAIDAWFNDIWLRQWILLEPQLHDIDLQPYFYFSRDSLGTLGTGVQRLNPLAQELLSKLLDESDAVRRQALKQITDINEADAGAIYSQLVVGVKREEDLGSENSMFSKLIELVSARNDLSGQLLSLLGELPEKTIPIWTIPKLMQICKNSAFEQNAVSLLKTWEASDVSRTLKKAAQAQLKRMSGQKDN